MKQVWAQRKANQISADCASRGAHSWIIIIVIVTFRRVAILGLGQYKMKVLIEKKAFLIGKQDYGSILEKYWWTTCMVKDKRHDKRGKSIGPIIESSATQVSPLRKSTDKVINQAKRYLFLKKDFLLKSLEMTFKFSYFDQGWNQTKGVKVCDYLK